MHFFISPDTFRLTRTRFGERISLFQTDWKIQTGLQTNTNEQKPLFGSFGLGFMIKNPWHVNENPNKSFLYSEPVHYEYIMDERNDPSFGIKKCTLKFRCGVIGLGENLHRQNRGDSRCKFCGCFETLKHFLFYCRAYTSIRMLLYDQLRFLCIRGCRQFTGFVFSLEI